MNRFGAFGVHLGISLIIFAVLAYLVVFHWYPDFFFETDGGWQGIRIIVLVDLVLGPLLTLIVYKRGKPGLKLDLTLIGLFQAVCLSAGVYIVYTERPIALVYSDGHFFSMSADDYRNHDEEVPDLSEIPGPMPKRVIVELPEDPHRQSDIRGKALRANKPLRIKSELYIPWSYNWIAGKDEGISYDRLRAMNDPNQTLANWLTSHGGKLEDYLFFPYAGRYEYFLLAMSRKDETITGLIHTSLRNQEEPSSE